MLCRVDGVDDHRTGDRPAAHCPGCAAWAASRLPADRAVYVFDVERWEAEHARRQHTQQLRHDLLVLATAVLTLTCLVSLLLAVASRG
jgi:hypothetical protein